MNTKLAFYILKRFFLALLTIFLVIMITFFVMHAIPGGPFLSEKSPSPEVTAALEAKYGLDKPIMEQFWTYLKGVLKFDFGPSIKQRGRSVTNIILEGFKVSAKLGLAAAGLAIVFGLVLGSLAAVFHNKVIDKVTMVLSTAFVAIPSFILATFLLLIFCVKLSWLPANGSTAGGLILPIIALSLYPMAYIIRLTRSSMLDVLGQDYIRTARAKGVKPNRVLFKHALRNAITPVITYAGPMIAFIVTGSLVVEKIFAVPGLGKYFVSSIFNRDYTLIMGTTIFLATLVIFMMLISDILYKVFDPRVELS
ncbi:MAG TPA: ABC transporter permease [Oscillospiraceae bacterium]|nr:ABC transporter permease [Oscillospiraceae bacterium]HPF55739.1 ABC transporter permease [Clostridiales bacterium]HPK34264.1 ABC transporter permease [Oscillospiraceae bacterium]HPR74833.1 ABC transporter permease [Oscillospiraceae bacterium]